MELKEQRVKNSQRDQCQVTCALKERKKKSFKNDEVC